MPVSFVTPSTRPGDLLAELRADLVERRRRVLDRVVQQRRAQRLGVEPHAGADLRHADRVDDEVLARLAALVGVVLAGEHERVDHAAAVDLAGDLVGVLLDDREQVGEQLALDRREVGGRLGRRGVRVIGAVDLLVRARSTRRRCRPPPARPGPRSSARADRSCERSPASVAQEPVVSGSLRAYDGRMQYRTLPVAAAALLVVLSASSRRGRQRRIASSPARRSWRVARPAAGGGSGFKRRERVRVTVTPTRRGRA